jgi:Thoeris protein ThsB, TIR-like domain
MARRTFISYKYSEAQETRDDILESLGKDAIHYMGETSDSPDISDTKTDNIKKRLKDMMYDTSVTIVIVTPKIKQSKWIDWEIEYSLKEITRNDRTSRSNGIVGVIQKVNGSYDWLVKFTKNDDGCNSRSIDPKLMYEIIYNNRINLIETIYSCEICQTVDILSGSYISLITEETFLTNPNKYIENAYQKASNINKFEICKTR